MNDKEKVTIRLIRKGDRKVFHALFELYYQRLFLYAKSYLESGEEAEDVVQELFIHLWEKRKELTVFSSLSSYLFRAVHNRCLQNLRHKKVVHKYRERHKLKIKEAEILYNSSSDFIFSEQQLKEIQQIFNRTNNTLPEKTREVFRLSRQQLKTNKEIAKMLNIQLKTVEYHITKALKVFNAALRDYFVIYLLIYIICR
jgi:RNA polymerase sigma-70 factor, ECF subfamily